jgi:hypothetical protein
MTDKKMEVKFASGCFDSFDGTQEELDGLIAEIHRLVETGEIFENSFELSDEDFEDLPTDVQKQIASVDFEETKRNLQ